MTNQELEPKKELKGCPFCGEKPKLFYGPNHAKTIVHWVECVNWKCPTSLNTHNGSEKDAIKFWNTRKEAKDLHCEILEDK